MLPKINKQGTKLRCLIMITFLWNILVKNLDSNKDWTYHLSEELFLTSRNLFIVNGNKSYKTEIERSFKVFIKLFCMPYTFITAIFMVFL